MTKPKISIQETIKFSIPQTLYLQILDQHGVPLEPGDRTHCETRVNDSDLEYRAVPHPELFPPEPATDTPQVYISFGGLLKPPKGNPSSSQLDCFLDEVLTLAENLGLDLETGQFAKVYFDDDGNQKMLGLERIVQE